MTDTPSLSLELQASHDSSTTPIRIIRSLGDDSWEVRQDTAAREEPLEIRIQGRSISVTMRTPGNDKELALGFLLSEGLIRNRNEVLEIVHCHHNQARDENVLNVFLAPTVEIDLARLTRNFFSSSSCGLCGKSSIESVHQHFPPIANQMTISAELLFELPERLRAAQKTFNCTGGLHASGIFNRQGELVVLREDIGRHNAVDKVIGCGILEGGFPFDSHVLLVSGRASFEIMQKALAARVPVVAAISAPSSLAVEFAKESRQTLVGFLRGKSMNIYSGSERISGSPVPKDR